MAPLNHLLPKLFCLIFILLIPCFGVNAGIRRGQPQECHWQCLADIETRQWSWRGPNGRGAVGGCNDGKVCRPNGGAAVPSGPCTERDYRAPVFGTCEATLATYQAACEAAGVPSPPPIGSPPWTNLGAAEGLIVNEETANDPTGTLFSWTGPNGGLCIALQRPTQTGIICTNRDGQRACFYNFEGEMSTGVAIANYQNPLVNPTTIDSCTSCHRGPGPFLVTQAVAGILNRVPKPVPTTPYIAVRAPGDWTTPASTNGFCQQCHAMPEPNLDWCVNVAIPAISSSYMPPMPKTDRQLQDAAALMALCCGIIKKQGIALPAECAPMENPVKAVLEPTAVERYVSSDAFLKEPASKIEPLSPEEFATKAAEIQER